MPSLNIFGTVVHLSAAGYSGPLGAGGNRLEITPISAGGAQNQFECAFEGEIPGGRISRTKWRMRCDLREEQLVAEHADLVIGGQLSSDDNLQLGVTKTQIKSVFVSTRRSHCVAFTTASRLIHPLLDAMVGGRTIVLDRDSCNQDLFGAAPDFERSVLCFFPLTNKPRVRVVHLYATGGHGQFLSDQQVPIKAVEVSAGRSLVLASADRLYVHGDLLDKRPISGANWLFFQHALVNGELALSTAHASPHEMDVRWVSTSGEPPVLLALRWRDENGHPLAFLPDSGSFQLAERVGFASSVPDGGNPNSIEWSNATSCVVGTSPQQWTLQALDPIAHYRKTEERHAQYGPVWLSAGAPREIHGMAPGVVLTCPAAFRKRALPCVFSSDAVHQDFHTVIGWLPQIDLGGNGSQWTLHAYLEERDSSADGSLSRRSATGQPDLAGPRLPLVDAMAAGVNLRLNTMPGGVVYKGLIIQALDKWVVGHDIQFVSSAPSWLASPAKLSNAPQAHATGFALLPGREHLGRILNGLKASADIQTLVPASPRLAPAPSHAQAIHAAEDSAPTGYVHGLAVNASFGSAVDEIEEHLKKSEVWNEAWYRLINQWVHPDGDLASAVEEIRRLLQIASSLPPFVGPDGDDDSWESDAYLEPWMQLRDRAIKVAALGDLDDIEVLDAQDLADWLSELDIEEFMHLCLAAKSSPDSERGAVLAPLVRWLDAPVGSDLFRRVARLLLLDTSAPRLQALKDICASAGLNLVQFAERLLCPGFVAQAPTLLTKSLAGILTDLGLAESSVLDALRAAWKDSTSAAFAALRDKFGPVLIDDLLDQIATSAKDAQALLDAFNATGQSFHDLAEVIRRPPEYLFATRRFSSAGPDWDKAMRLWSGRFDLAKLSDGTQWGFFLGDASSLIVKLGDKRSITDVLKEVHERFTTPARSDPLGLAAIDPAQKNKSFEGGLALLTSKLGERLVEPRWTGLLMLRPTADISADLKMRDLCGFEYIDALFVAVAGRPLAGGMDITAAIECRAEADAVAELKGRSPDQWQGDVDFGLTRFSVLIRRSVLDAADIAFQLRIKNLMGKAHPSTPSDTEVRSITLRGTLPPADPSQPNKPRDIQFAVALDPPTRVEIDLFCLKHVDFWGLRVGVRDGQTFLNIDADLQFQQVSEGAYLEFFRSLEKLKMQGFRLALPSLQPGDARGIGQALGLDFDWPSLEFSMPRARALQLFGLEVTPTAFGILRNAGAALSGEWDAFKAKFGSIDNWPLPSLTPGQDLNKIEVPYLRLRAQFGALPGLGGSGKLSFDMAFGLPIFKGSPGTPFIAVEGFAGKDLELDLFRIITLKIKQLVFKRDWTLRLDGFTGQKASGLLVDQAELKVLNWNPFGDGGRISLVNLHRTDDQVDFQDHGFIAAYEKSSKPSSSGFVKVHWVVMGKNIELRKKAYDYLLSGADSTTDVGEVRSMMDEMLVYKDKEAANSKEPVPAPREFVEGVLGARFTRNPNWLFAISFSLGDLLELGTLVLHDQHYYGIRLRDPRWVAAVFGQDTIEFAYIPGARRELDRFRTNLRIPMLDMLGPMTSGEIALEWAVNWDFLIDFGFPWKTPAGHDWFRAFSLPVGTYEGKFGFYLEKKTSYEPTTDDEVLMLGCGVALYIGLYAGYGNSVAFVRAGIGIFGIFEGRFWLKKVQFDKPETLLKSTIVRMEVSGTIGIFAYAEGRIDVWILSASFRAWAEASLTSTIIFVPGGTCAIEYSALMAAGYSASCKVGSGWFSWTFRVSGSVSMPVSGRLLLA